MKSNLYELDFEDLTEVIHQWKEPEFRSLQIWQGLYVQYWDKIEHFSNLPLPLRKRIKEQFIFGSLKTEKVLESADRLTTKTLYRLADGTAIETVLMRYNDRKTACVSSQVGCALGCDFCATGKMGFTRNLTRGEIIEQVIMTASYLKSKGESLTNVVFMGMGEPFHNYEAVLGAIRELNDADGFGMGARRFTVSTVGIVPGIKRLAKEELQINLAVSLHAVDDELRTSIVPINKKYSIDELLIACKDYIQKTNRRVSIEWALIKGLNDTEDQAKKLVSLLSGLMFHVNLIQLNPVPHYDGKPTQDQAARLFKEIISDAGIPCTIRLRRGIDIRAGCGQLVSESKTIDS